MSQLTIPIALVLVTTASAVSAQVCSLERVNVSSTGVETAAGALMSRV